MADDALPPLVTKLIADLSDLEAGLARGKVLVDAFRDDVASSFGGGVGQQIGKDISDGIQDAVPEGFAAVEADAKRSGERAGQEFTDGLGEQVKKDLPPKVEEPLEESSKKSGTKSGAAFANAFSGSLGRGLGSSGVLGDALTRGLGEKGGESGKQFSVKFSDGVRDGLTESNVDTILSPDSPAGEKIVEDAKKTGDKAGKSAGDAGGSAISPLIIAGFAAAATAGPGLLLGATAAAVVGGAALITKSNDDLTYSYRKLAGDASDAIDKATAPIVPAINSSLQILDQGINRAAPQLRNLFTAAIPEATQLATGVSDLANNALPGVVTALRSAAPYGSMLATDLGKLGTGVSELFQGLSIGAKGGAVGLDALVTVVEHLLGDLGTITGALSNGLGPALHDIGVVALPVVDGLAKFISVLNPNVIRAAADAAALLFAAFKIGTLTGLVGEGTTFVAFLKSAAAAEITLTGETGVLATATSALGTAMDALAGPLGIVIAAIPLITQNTSQYGLATADAKGKTIDLSDALQKLSGDLKSAGDGSRSAQREIDMIVSTFKELKDSGANLTPTLDSLDQQLARLALEDPKAGAKEYSAVLKDLGLSAQQGAEQFPQYTTAIKDNANAVKSAAASADDYANATYKAVDPARQLLSTVTDSQQKIAQQAAAAALAANAALSYADNTATLNTKISESVAGYTEATSAANAYKNAQDALFGKYGDYSQAQATFTTDVANAANQLTKGKNAIDLNTAAGAKNFTVLNQLSEANEQVAESFIKQGGSVADADRKLQDGAIQIDNLAKKAGFSATQVAQLNTDLYGTAKIKDIHVSVSADTSPAMNAVNDTIRYIDNRIAYLQVQTRGGAPGGKALYDGGGWTKAAPGQPEDAVVHGGEYVLSRDMLAGRQTIDPQVLTALRGGYSGAGAQAVGYVPGGGSSVVNIFVQAGTVLTSTIQFQQAVTAALAQQGLRMTNQNLSVQAVRGLKPA